jgi:hypothetical protein
MRKKKMLRKQNRGEMKFPQKVGKMKKRKIQAERRRVPLQEREKENIPPPGRYEGTELPMQ